MTVTEINKSLFRPLASGSEFEKLIPKYEKVEHEFDKESDNSNTFDTLNFMEQWSKKYSWQMQKIAPLMKGKTLAETCNNIYNFLYWHFQYKLDGVTQILYSPSAAWRFRQNGFDCKTYSLLASTILSNLGIRHAFRMVKQSSPKWSHVYVIVPNEKSYYVIDATKHTNTEVSFSTKYDKYMHHIGLASPYKISGLGCSCQGKPVANTGLGNPNNLSQSIKNFHVYLNALERQGFPRAVTNNMMTIVKSNLQRGIDPNMKEVVQKAILMAQHNGLGFDIGQTGTAITGAINGEPASIKYLVSQVIPTGFISSTFGAVFQNGFDLSCWGASLTPAKAADAIKNNHLPHFNYRLTAIANATNNNDLQGAINLFIKDAYTLHKYYNVYKPVSANWSACAKKGIKLYQDFMSPLKIKADLLVQEFQSKGATVRTEKLMPIDFQFKKAITGNVDEDEIRNEADTAFVDYPQVYLSTAVFTSPTTPVTPATTSGSTSSTTANIPKDLQFSQNSDGTITVTNPATGEVKVMSKAQAMQLGYKPASKGISSGAILIGGGIAMSLLFVFPKNNSKTTINKNKK